MLARLALRLAAVAALDGRTIAEDRVDDSRLAALAPEDVPDDGLPVIMAITDDDDGEAFSEQDGGPPFDRLIDLCLELSMQARVQYIDPGNPAESIYNIEAPDTDARLDASLDFLEFQTVRELACGYSPFAREFQRIARIVSRSCHRAAADDGTKIASRLLTLRCRVNDDEIEEFVGDDVLPTGLNVLPEPLRSVAKLLPPTSSGGKICAEIAAKLQPVVVGGVFAGADIRADARDAVQTPEPDDGEIQIAVNFPQD